MDYSFSRRRMLQGMALATAAVPIIASLPWRGNSSIANRVGSKDA